MSDYKLKLGKCVQKGLKTYRYLLHISGIMDGRECEFLVGIGKTAHEKHHFRVGDVVSGESHLVEKREIDLM